MKPVRLEFSGINSFSEHTIIDFESLTKSGIFGIFGDTGSGKSTILDCINFALYGNVERSREKTDIINYRSNSAEVKFVFNILNGGARKTYTVDRVLKRDKTGTHKAFLFEGDECIAEKTTEVQKKIVEILGVDDEDFRKCIALPQGEFSQFVKSTPSGRLALIERLFSLTKYGDRLKEKLARKQTEAEAEYQNVCGRLYGYSEVTKEALTEKKEQLKACKKQLDELTASLNLAVKNCEKLQLLHDKLTELEQTRQKLQILQAQKAEMDGLKKDLSALPTCKEAAKAAEEKMRKESESVKLEADIKTLCERLAAESAAVTSIERQLQNGELDEKIEKCLKLSASYRTCEGKPEKLKEVLTRLEKKRAEYRTGEENRLKLLKDKERAEAEVNETQAALDGCAETDLQHLINVKFKGAILRDEYANNLGYFARLLSSIKEFEEPSPLYGFVNKEITEKIEEYKQRLLAVKDFKLDEAEKNLKELRENDELKKKLQAELSARRERLQKYSSAAEIALAELKTVQKDGAELRARADELNEELCKVFGENCADYSAAVNENEDALKNFTELKRQLSEKLERAKVGVNDLNVSIERLKTLQLTCKAEIENLNKKLEAAIAESGLGSLENCLKLTEKAAGYADAEKTLSEYEKQLSALTEKFNALKDEKDGEEYSDDKFNAAAKRRNGLEAAKTALTGSYAVLEADCKTLEKRLKEKAELNKEFALIEKERNLILQLKEATKGNKFLEFIANEYLCDISALASTTLLKLTDGRYFLNYKDNNFYVADNFDCGNLRGVNTLSGGETFLVSLSLALALSQTICAKSLKSIEFFFLDEGFGTLDSALVETVMTALEKLKSSQFTIGVISHVEELKHRIESKITVKKATESHGSTVQISC